MSLLCGFLGAGKTTLLKHVLETKHSEEGFKCAVIVNDMATLNIDKSLIDQSALVQTDEVNLHHSLLQCTFLRRRVAKSPNLSSKSLEFLQFVIKLDPSQIELCILEKNIIFLKFSYSEKAMFCHEFSNGSLNLSFLIH